MECGHSGATDEAGEISRAKSRKSLVESGVNVESNKEWHAQVIFPNQGWSMKNSLKVGMVA